MTRNNPPNATDRRNSERVRSSRRLLINPHFQIVFLSGMGGLALIAVGIAYAVSRRFLHEFERVALDMGLSIDHALFGLLKEQRHAMDWGFALSALGIVIVLTTGGLVLSHLIAGPIYRLESHMNRIEEENGSRESLNEVSFRKGDFFPELATSYNRILKRLRKG